MSDELQREKEERLLQIAALACQAEEDREYEKFLNSEEYVPPDAAWMEKVDKELRTPPKRRLPHFKKLAAVAAMLIVLLCAGAGTAIANPKALENLFSQDHERYSQVRVDDGVVLDKPEDWDSEYYPTWAPKGFHIESVTHGKDLNNLCTMTLLSNNTGKQIWVSIARDEIDGYPNTENLEETEIVIFGEQKSAYVSADGRTLQSIVKIDEGSMIIGGEITKEELQTMIESVKNLK